MSFRTHNVKDSNVPCLCPFHEKFLPVFNNIVPNDVKHAKMYHFHQFGDMKFFLQHCDISKNWYHKMLVEYLKAVYSYGSNSSA